MIWKLILLVVIYLVTIEATPNDDDDVEFQQDYDFESWKLDVWILYRFKDKRAIIVDRMLDRLKRMKLFENSSEFKSKLQDPESMKRLEKIAHYIKSISSIVEATTLLRKPKNISENMFEIVNNHNGCSKEEISKIDAVNRVFGSDPRIGRALETIKNNTVSHCWRFYRGLMYGTTKLIGKQTLDTVARISDIINYYVAFDLRNSGQRSIQATVYSIFKAVASYLHSLNHPLLSYSDTMNSAEYESIFAEVYETEVQQPLSIFCEILKPIRQNLVRLTSDVNVYNLSNKEKLVDLSCGLATSSAHWKLNDIASLLKNEAPYGDDDQDEEFLPHGYSLMSWKKDIYSLFGKLSSKHPNFGDTIYKLKRIRFYEYGAEFRLNISSNDFHLYKRFPVIRGYLDALREIPEITSLMHKTKGVSENLIDILKDQNGCYWEEFSKIYKLSLLFRDGSRMRKLLRNVNDKRKSYCWQNITISLTKRTNLIGKESFDTILKLIDYINMKRLADYAKNQDNPDQVSIESTSRGLAIYLDSINHPLLEYAELDSFSKLKSTIEEIYEIEIQNASSVFCRLLGSIRRNVSHLGNDKDIEDYRKLVDFSCNLASLSISHIVPIIARHFLDIMLDPDFTPMA